MNFIPNWLGRVFGRAPKPSGKPYSVPLIEVHQQSGESDSVTFQFAEIDPARVRGRAADAVVVDDRQDVPGPGHPDWAGRAAIPLVAAGWALPGHPLYVYQQFLKYQHDDALPEGWKVIGWTPEGVSYIVPEAHWTEKERLSAHPTVRSQHSPYATPDEVCRERLKATHAGLMSDAEIDERVAQYRAYTTRLNEDLAALLDHVRAGAERHAMTRLDSNDELREAVELRDDRHASAKVRADRVAAWVKECGQRAVDKRLADARKLIADKGLLAGIPVDDHIYLP